MAIFSALERLNFTGKKVLAIMTHEGNGLGSCERDLKKICKGATFGRGLAVYGADAAQNVCDNIILQQQQVKDVVDFIGNKMGVQNIKIRSIT